MAIGTVARNEMCSSSAPPHPEFISFLYCDINSKLNEYDTLLLFTEVQADETKAVDAVLKADKKRTALLEECKKLEEESDKGNTKNSTRLKEVGTKTMSTSTCNINLTKRAESK